MRNKETNKRLFYILEPALGDMGYEIVDIELLRSTQNILRITIDNYNREAINTDDCSAVSRFVGNIIEVEDLISSKYILEVTSAGLERPLTKIEHFIRFQGEQVSLHLFQGVDGRKKISGKIKLAKENKVVIELTNPVTTVIISLDSIKKANLVLTKEKFRELIK